MKFFNHLNSILFLSLFLITSLFAFEDNESISINDYSEDENFISLEHDSLAYLEDLRVLEAIEANEAAIDDPDPLDMTSKDPAPMPQIVDAVAAAVSWDGGAGTTSWSKPWFCKAGNI